jgi:hypothetical protein
MKESVRVLFHDVVVTRPTQYHADSIYRLSVAYSRERFNDVII